MKKKVRVTIWLLPEQRKLLKSIGRVEGASISELVRRAVVTKYTK